MRKVFILLLAGLMIAGFAQVVQAAEFQTSGFYRIGFNLSNNNLDFTDLDGAELDLIPGGAIQPRVSATPGPTGLHAAVPIQNGDDSTISYMQQRFGYNLAWVTDKNLKAVISMEVDDGFGVWGGEATANKAAIGLAGGSVGQFKTDDHLAVEIKNLYLEFLIPGTPVTAKLGEQTYFIGQYYNFLLVDAAGITLTTDLKPFLFSAFTYKIREGAVAGADDTDMYGLWFRGTTSGVNIQAYGMFQNQNSATNVTQATTAPLPVATVNTSRIGQPGTTIDRFIGLTDANRNAFNDPASLDFTRGLIRKADFWWLGASGETKFGPMSIFANAIWSQVDADLSPGSILTAPTSFKTSGLLADLIFGYQLGGIKLEVEGLWTSQIDLQKDEPDIFFAPNSEASAVSGKGLVFFSPIWDYSIGRTNTASETAYAGIWLGRASASMKVPAMTGLTTTLNFVWIQDNVRNGDMYGDFGNTREDVALVAGSARNNVNGDDDTIGQEVDLLVNYPIYKNLVLDAGFGYLFAGQALDGFKFNATTGLVERRRADDAWVAAARLIYTF